VAIVRVTVVLGGSCSGGSCPVAVVQVAIGLEAHSVNSAQLFWENFHCWHS